MADNTTEAGQRHLLLLAAGEGERRLVEQAVELELPGPVPNARLAVGQAQLARAVGDLVTDGRVEQHGLRVLKEQHTGLAETAGEGPVAQPRLGQCLVAPAQFAGGGEMGPFITFSSVDLPQPLAPSSTTFSPWGRSSARGLSGSVGRRASRRQYFLVQASKAARDLMASVDSVAEAIDLSMSVMPWAAAWLARADRRGRATLRLSKARRKSATMRSRVRIWPSARVAISVRVGQPDRAASTSTRCANQKPRKTSSTTRRLASSR